MKQRKLRSRNVPRCRVPGDIPVSLLPLALLLLLASLALAWAQGGYSLSWWTVDGGGGVTGGSDALGGTAGQPDAAVWQGGGYTLSGGFWESTPPARHTICLPLVVKAFPQDGRRQ